MPVTLLAVCDGDVNPSNNLPRADARLHVGPLFMETRKTLRRVIYGARCENPNETIGGAHWNKVIDSGNYIVWTDLGKGFFS